MQKLVKRFCIVYEISTFQNFSSSSELYLIYNELTAVKVDRLFFKNCELTINEDPLND